MQAAIGHRLTVHGTGGQTVIHSYSRYGPLHRNRHRESLRSPAQAARAVNEVTETHRVLDLAKLVGDTTGAEVAYLPKRGGKPIRMN